MAGSHDRAKLLTSCPESETDKEGSTIPFEVSPLNDLKTSHWIQPFKVSPRFQWCQAWDQTFST
jgi:hypothetical protein